MPGRGRRLLATRLPERYYRLIALAAVVSLVALIASGTWVRLSESGLGCPTWPTCYHGQLAAHDSYHALVEFVNRCVITVVGVLVGVAFLGALRRRNPRRDLVWLSLGLVVGYLGEAVLGGITVLLKLSPTLVALHLVLAMVLLVDAVHLHWRAGDLRPRDAGASPRKSMAEPPGSYLVLLVRLTLATVTALVVLGTVATGSGARAGSPDTPRFALSFASTVAFHAAVGTFLLGLLVAGFFMLAAVDAPRGARRAHLAATVAVLVQGAIGIAQYYTHLDTTLVELHVVGAALIVIALARFNLELGPPRKLEDRDMAPLRVPRLAHPSPPAPS